MSVKIINATTDGRFRKKKKKFFLLLLIVLLTGCQANTLSFTGKGEYWSAEVIIHQTSGKESEDIKLKYIGDNVQSVGSIRYSVKTNSWSTGEGGIKLNKEGIYVDEGKSINDKKTPEDATLTIDIKWDGKSETFQLINGN